MAKKSYHVIAKSDGQWSVKRTGADRVTGKFSTQKEAEQEARNIIKRSGGGEIIVHKKDGRVSTRVTLSSNQNPPKDSKRNCVGSNPHSVKG